MSLRGSEGGVGLKPRAACWWMNTNSRSAGWVMERDGFIMHYLKRPFHSSPVTSLAADVRLLTTFEEKKKLSFQTGSKYVVCRIIYLGLGFRKICCRDPSTPFNVSLQWYCIRQSCNAACYLPLFFTNLACRNEVGNILKWERHKRIIFRTWKWTSSLSC